MYLIEFRYEYYCQGYDWTQTHALVEATSFEEACNKIAENKEYHNACEFIDKTIR